MPNAFRNVYEDEERARAYAGLAFPGTYYLAFRDIPSLVRRHVGGTRALDFGCGAGRSSRFLRDLGLSVVGVDIAAAMLEEARRRDPAADYRQVGAGDLRVLEGMSFDLVLAAFTFDNIPTDAEKAASLAAIRNVLAPGGRLVIIVSSPEIYIHEWTSFSTRDFPENREARDGDRVRITMLDVPDRRPVEDVLCGDARYRQLFAGAHLKVLERVCPLASGEEPVSWVSETVVSPWSVYVLGAL
ncbi:MAG TPA: methyltransferase domain-containing protein [Candidatus Saccharimonadales bacterium]|nr:methyltransferase domain-containing protein [Candidatus Saccharimonadales bacterium]